ncbi:hypothetical protein FA95DRAFT_1601369 [Auriscalpium vulgare]|uniref:Uncharacterized protein n=1 Tax=Auriscalpium vulgare TaxID=40419 RepID=A0ACB8SA18_9AGAM|nr:hypothetical protein FA95DRAFT_1601369 [Auriscalpium vulgare]
MSPMSSLQQAWDLAQPRLNSVKDSLFSIASPTTRIIRVGQLDAELLDQELVNILRDPLSKALGLIHSTLKTRFEPELVLVIQLTLYRLSVWNSGASYGAKLQDLTYRAPASSAKHLSPTGLPRRLLLIHGSLTIIVPYLHNRIRGRALSKAWPDAPSSDRRRKAWDLLTRLETLHGVLALGSFVSFLWDGRYRTLADRLLGMQLVPARPLIRRDVSYEFMNRQMVWHAFTVSKPVPSLANFRVIRSPQEFLLFILPLLPHRTLRRAFSTGLSAVTHPLTALPILLPARARALMGMSEASGEDSKLPTPPHGKYWHLSSAECAVCHENAAVNLNLSEPANALAQASGTGFYAPSASQGTSTGALDSDEPPAHPITTPYAASCGHTYCYACIAERMLRAADEGTGPWECLRCGVAVHLAQRVQVDEMYWASEGEGEGSVEEWGSDYFDELGSSISGVSGSMGSRSWVSGSDEDRSE